AAQLEVVELIEQPHQVGRDEVAWAARAQNLDLQVLKFCVRVRDKPLEVKTQRGIVDRHGACGKGNLLPCRVRLTPERRAPRLVEMFERPIPTLQPALEGSAALLAKAASPMSGKLVVDLPPDHRTVLAVMVCQGCDDLPRIPPVDSSRRAVVAAAAEANPHAVRIHREDLRVPLDEPRRG